VYGMRISDGSRGEWDQFLATAVVRLHDLDEQLTGPALVSVVRSSAVGFPLANERWRHLRFVTTTPMTPLRPGEADYVLSPEPLSGGRRASNRGRPAAPVLQLASRQGTFALYLYRAGPQKPAPVAESDDRSSRGQPGAGPVPAPDSGRLRW
ncbi:MAG: hypothetical protein M3N52_02995, partial [Actinomycetota bacterium]|nr:hypothetical protein [Actinomycetota bacterium]